MVWICIILVALAVVGWLWAIRLRHKQEEVASVNKAVAIENQQLETKKQELEDQYNEEKQKLNVLRSTIQTQQGVLKQVAASIDEATIKKTQERDEAIATLKEEYDRAALDFQKKKESQEQAFRELVIANQQEIEKYNKKIQALKGIESAYIEARKKEEAAQAEKDLYRLAIAPSDIEDVKALRSIQKQFSKPEVIDKVVWETYYKPAYDALMGRLSDKATLCGIYKITNLTTGQAYIGQSVNIKERFRQHIKAGLSSASATNKLYSAMKQYGVENFTFMILEEVPREKLNEQEAFWIDFYQTKDSGLNSTKGNA